VCVCSNDEKLFCFKGVNVFEMTKIGINLEICVSFTVKCVYLGASNDEEMLYRTASLKCVCVT